MEVSRARSRIRRPAVKECYDRDNIKRTDILPAAIRVMPAGTVKKESRSNCALPKQDRGPQEDGQTSIFYYNGNEYTLPTESWTEALDRYKAQTDVEHGEVSRRRLHILAERHESGASKTSFAARLHQGDPGCRVSTSRSEMT